MLDIEDDGLMENMSQLESTEIDESSNIYPQQDSSSNIDQFEAMNIDLPSGIFWNVPNKYDIFANPNIDDAKLSFIWASIKKRAKIIREFKSLQKLN